MKFLPNIKTHTPIDPKLKKQIAYYYFLKNHDTIGNLEFWHYPHYNSTLNFFKKSQIILKDNARHVLPSSRYNYASVYSSNVKTAKKAILYGPYDIIGVVFKPLGMNHFISLTSKIQNQECIVGELEDSVKPRLDLIYQTDCLQKKSENLDALLREMYLPFQAPILHKALSQIIASNGKTNLEELTSDLGVNRRTLLRYFQQHLGYSFRDFKAVVKFRSSLNQGIKQPTRLSDLAYDANYYDQSDFIRHFKLKANETPRSMLKSVTRITDQLVWKFR